MEILHLVQTKAPKDCAIPGASTPDKIQTTKTKVRNQLLVLIMLGGVNNARYGKLKDKLVNDFAKGSNTYPQTTDELLSLMNINCTGVKMNCFLVPKN